jgi:hypothetical protein
MITTTTIVTLTTALHKGEWYSTLFEFKGVLVQMPNSTTQTLSWMSFYVYLFIYSFIDVVFLWLLTPTPPHLTYSRHKLRNTAVLQTHCFANHSKILLPYSQLNVFCILNNVVH